MIILPYFLSNGVGWWSMINREYYMGARRYGISLRVEHEKRNSISTSNHVLFCLSYKHNSPFLGRKSDLTDECKKKGIGNPRITIVECVGADY